MEAHSIRPIRGEQSLGPTNLVAQIAPLSQDSQKSDRRRKRHAREEHAREEIAR